MRELLLVGASGFAREVLEVVRTAAALETPVGVLDDDPKTWGSAVGGVPVLGGLEEVRKYPMAALVVCIGNGRSRHSVVSRLTRLGVRDSRFVTIIEPSAQVPPSCTIGPGSVLLAQVVLTADVTIGSHVVVMPHVTLTHDDVIEDFATLAAGVKLGGSVRVGERAYLGMGSAVRERLRVGRDAVLGMGGVLLQDLPDGQTWFGVPARCRLTTSEGGNRHLC